MKQQDRGVVFMWRPHSKCTTIETRSDKPTKDPQSISCYQMFFLSGFTYYIYATTANYVNSAQNLVCFKQQICLVFVLTSFYWTNKHTYVQYVHEYKTVRTLTCFRYRKKQEYCPASGRYDSKTHMQTFNRPWLDPTFRRDCEGQASQTRPVSPDE